MTLATASPLFWAIAAPITVLTIAFAIIVIRGSWCASNPAKFVLDVIDRLIEIVRTFRRRE